MSRSGSWVFPAAMAVLAVLAAAAHAALPPEHYRAAYANAPHHLQLRLVRVTLLRGQALDNCEVEATVLRDFRGALEEGTPLRFRLHCTAPGLDPMPGPDAWHEYGALKAARFAEGFFRGVGAQVAPVYGMLALVPAGRGEPWCEAASGRCDLPHAAVGGSRRP